MIDFSKIILPNGLKVIVHEDNSTPLVAMNLLYDVGSRDDNPELTGMAHLFEHLMFGGTERIPDFDTPLQLAGGENNAFTSNDITNYYITVPADNIETAFWLESDRMMKLDFSQKNLDTQKSVVTEEFSQRYLNQPYGDAMLYLRQLAYRVHPYRWPAIGIDPAHIAGTRLEDIKDFFYSHYAPDNAILTLSGNINTEKAFRLASDWFGSIEKRNVPSRSLPSEPRQDSAREKVLERDVPSYAVYKAWHICGRKDDDFHAMDLITDILAGGESGRLHNELVRGMKIFSEINAWITSDLDPGLMIVTGKLMQGITPEAALKAVDEVISGVSGIDDKDDELAKVKNKYESSLVFQNTSVLNKAMNLAYYELLGDPGLINTEADAFHSVSARDVRSCLNKYLKEENSSTLIYIPAKKQ